MFNFVWGKSFAHSSNQYAGMVRAVEAGERALIRCVVLALSMNVSTAVGGAEIDEYIPFDISQQRADLALTQFAEQADLTLIFPFNEVREKMANRLVGEYPVEEAVEMLLAGTGLKPTFSNRAVLNIATENRPGSEGDQMNTDKKTGLIALLAGLFGVSANAQDRPEFSDVGVLEEIIVTSQRREQSLREVPISVTAFTEEMLRNNMIDDLTGYFNKTPNVSFMEGGARSSRSISIRGVSDVGGLTSSFAVYVDEFNVANGPTRANDNNINSSLNPQLQDVERIEVLRGPQGTFFGRNAAGGAINVITKKPQPEFYAEGSLEYGRFDTWNLGGVVNGSVIDDKLFVRASAYYAQSDGFVTNVNPIGGDSGWDYLNYRLSGRLLPTDRLTIDVSFADTTEEQGFDASVPSGVLERSSAGLATSLGIMPQPLLGAVDAYPNNRTQVDLNIPQTQENDFTVTTGRIEYEADNFNVVSVTGYLDTKHESSIDLDLTPADYMRQLSTIETDSFSQELRIQSTRDGNFDWVFGGLYAVDNLVQDFLVTVGEGGLFFGLPDLAVLADGLIDTKRTSYAFFGEATWRPSDRWSLTAGVRYSDDTVRRIENRFSGGAQLPEAAGEESFDDVSPKFSLTYAVNDDVTMYGTISRGYKAGGLQTNIENPAFAVTAFEEETLWNYEAGIKADLLDNRMYFGASLFFMDWSDVQVLSGLTLIDPDTGLPTFLLSTDNAASATSSGVELEFRALLAEGLAVGGGVGYLDAKFDDFPDALIFGMNYDLSDTPLPRAPEWTANADAQYSFSLRNDMEAFVRGEFSYRDEAIPLFDSTVVSGFPWRTPSFSVWNFRAGVIAEKFQITGYVENAFDKEYFTGIDPTFGFSGVMIRPSQRIYGIRFVMHTL